MPLRPGVPRRSCPAPNLPPLRAGLPDEAHGEGAAPRLPPPALALLAQPGGAQAGDQLANYRCHTDVSSVNCLDFSCVCGGGWGCAGRRESHEVRGLRVRFCLSSAGKEMDFGHDVGNKSESVVFCCSFPRTAEPWRLHGSPVKVSTDASSRLSPPRSLSLPPAAGQLAAGPAGVSPGRTV